jgi:hypothetical protein
MTDVGKVLIEKCTAEPVACVREEGIDRRARRRGPQPIDAIRRGEIDFRHGDVGAETAKALSGRSNLWAIGSH